MSTTKFIAISSQQYPHSIYFEGVCYTLLDDRHVSSDGLVLDYNQLKKYEDCAECLDNNPQNTLYVHYEE